MTDPAAGPTPKVMTIADAMAAFVNKKNGQVRILPPGQAFYYTKGMRAEPADMTKRFEVVSHDPSTHALVLRGADGRDVRRYDSEVGWAIKTGLWRAEANPAAIKRAGRGR